MFDIHSCCSEEEDFYPAFEHVGLALILYTFCIATVSGEHDIFAMRCSSLVYGHHFLQLRSCSKS